MSKNEKLLKILRKRKSTRLFSRLLRYSINFYKVQLIKRLEHDKLIRHIKHNTFFGTTMNLNLPELVSKSIYLYGYFEPSTSHALIKLLKEGDYFVDVGAHIGYYSLLASEIVGNSGKVYSFEPTPSTLQTLLANVHGKTNINVKQIALWSEKKKLEFHDFGIGDSVFNSFYSARTVENKKYNSIEVQTDTLENFFKEGEKMPNVIKIDAESAELEILKGAKNILEQYAPKIIMEIGDFGDPNVAPSNDIIVFLEKMGYRIYEFSSDSFIELKKMKRYPSMNIYCEKNL